VITCQGGVRGRITLRRQSSLCISYSWGQIPFARTRGVRVCLKSLQTIGSKWKAARLCADALDRFASAFSRFSPELKSDDVSNVVSGAEVEAADRHALPIDNRDDDPESTAAAEQPIQFSSPSGGNLYTIASPISPTDFMALDDASGGVGGVFDLDFGQLGNWMMPESLANYDLRLHPGLPPDLG
jgi:hypothetical protein